MDNVEAVTRDAEYYFIQFCFCRNRDLLRADARMLYDAMFIRYLAIYTEGVNARVDVIDINKKFENHLTGGKNERTT